MVEALSQHFKLNKNKKYFLKEIYKKINLKKEWNKKLVLKSFKCIRFFLNIKTVFNCRMTGRIECHFIVAFFLDLGVLMIQMNWIFFYEFISRCA